jgi:hypothetical protein
MESNSNVSIIVKHIMHKDAIINIENMLCDNSFGFIILCLLFIEKIIK